MSKSGEYSEAMYLIVEAYKKAPGSMGREIVEFLERLENIYDEELDKEGYFE
ncbi:hypothetical protein D3C80_965360 [compost metagenome]